MAEEGQVIGVHSVEEWKEHLKKGEESKKLVINLLPFYFVLPCSLDLHQYKRTRVFALGNSFIVSCLNEPFCAINVNSRFFYDIDLLILLHLDGVVVCDAIAMLWCGIFQNNRRRIICFCPLMDELKVRRGTENTLLLFKKQWTSVELHLIILRWNSGWCCIAFRFSR